MNQTPLDCRVFRHVNAGRDSQVDASWRSSACGKVTVFGILVGVALGLASTGCKPSGGNEVAPSASGNASKTAPKPRPVASTTAREAEPEQPPPLEMPLPKLSEAHAATCLVEIGNAFPLTALNDTAGQTRELRSLFGKAATVVAFFHGESIYSGPMLSDLQYDVLGEYGERGIAVVAVSVKQDPAAATKLASENDAKYPVLLDADGKYFAQIATEGLPRLYLLDADGKLLWFDIEYSRDTREQLDTAIRYTLGER